MSSLDKIVACQISYLPLKTENVEEKVEKVLYILRNSGLEYKIGSFASEIKGTKARVFSAIKDIRY